MAAAALATRVVARTLPHGLPVARTLVHRGLDRVFGPPPFEPDDPSGDQGLFGPGSATWRVIGEPAAIVGGIRALLTQLLHPHAMAGVADHSRYRDDPLARLQGTAAWVTTAAFGTTDNVLAVSRHVRRIHRRVRDTAPDGREYAADDPQLLTWVSVALTSSFLATDAAYAPRPAVGTDADAFVAEQSRAAALLDPRVDLAALDRDPDARRALRDGTHPLPLLDDGRLPTSVAELEACLAAFAGALGVNAQGREALRFLLLPPIPRPLLAGYLPLLAGALTTLDDRACALLRVPHDPVTRRAARLQASWLLTALRATAGPSPSLKAARHRVAASAAAR